MASFPVDDDRSRSPEEGDDADPAAPATTIALATPGMLIAEALARLLREHGLHIVGCYTTPAAVLDKVGRCHPGVVIVDADLAPHAGGARALLCDLREASPATRSVVLAGDVDAALARAVMDCQASAVILKSSPAADAVGIVQQVIGGRTSFPGAVLARIAEPDTPGELSARQLEVLEQLALGHPNEVIARNLYISVNTVKFHLHAIYERLGVHNRVEAAGVFAARRFAPTRPGGASHPEGGEQPPSRTIHSGISST
jgi:DNA-binding NarL/FixJ family response regulator